MSEETEEPVVLAGRWRLDALLGVGGMGSVYRATELTVDRVVAVKMLSPEWADNADLVARFEREARLLAKLDHPALVPLLSVDRHEGAPFIVLKYVEGKTLSALLKERTRFAVRQLLPLLSQLCSGLDYLHSRGIVHRDLKPNNIIVDENDRLTLLDFGVSRQLKSSRLTEPGMLVGTPMYMAPEQILTDHSGPPADIYALALMTYQLLVGQHPFAGSPEQAQVIVRQLGELPVRATLKNPAVPEPVARVLERSLAKEPDARHPTAQAFYEALVAAFGTDRTDASYRDLASPSNQTTDPLPLPPRRPAWLIPTLVAGALALGALAWRLLS